VRVSQQPQRVSPDTGPASPAGDQRPGPGRRPARAREGRAGLAMTSPFLVLYLLFFLAPFIYSFVLSLRSPRTNGFVGLFNYGNVVSDSQFWAAVERMAYFGVIQVTLMICIAIALALLLDSPYIRGKKFFALAYFFPYAVPGVIAAVMWAFLLEPDLDNALNVPHLIGISGGAVNPLSYRLVLYAMMLIVTWEWAGYNMTILLTSLTSVPREILESGKTDGASELALAWRIKLPMIRRTIAFITVISIIGTLQLFNEPVILNDIASIGSTYTPNQLIYNSAFQFGNEQLAAAQSIILAMVTVVATGAFYGIMRRRFNIFGAVRGGRR
jgi:multiple sugar transport system permease protein